MKNRKIIFLSMLCASLSLCCSEENKAGPNTTVEQKQHIQPQCSSEQEVQRRDLARMRKTLKDTIDLANVNADKCTALRRDYDKLERRQCCRIFSVGCACLSLGILFTSVGFLAFEKSNTPLCPQATNSTCNCTSATPYNVTSVIHHPPQFAHAYVPAKTVRRQNPIKNRTQARKQIHQPRGKR